MARQQSRFPLIAACFASGLIAAACAAVAPEPVNTLPRSDLAGTRWVAQSIAGQAVEGRAPTISFNVEDRLSGSGGCNTLTGVYETDAGAIAVRGLGATERACAETLMRQEMAFLAVLAKAARYERQDTQLVLADEGGRSIVFAPAA
jgi:putative lipoprotein